MVNIIKYDSQRRFQHLHNEADQYHANTFDKGYAAGVASFSRAVKRCSSNNFGPDPDEKRFFKIQKY
jgi:hypothetical protein